jgi:hypothetical protein
MLEKSVEARERSILVMLPVGPGHRTRVAQPTSDDSLRLSCHSPVIPRLDLRLTVPSVTNTLESIHTLALVYGARFRFFSSLVHHA